MSRTTRTFVYGMILPGILGLAAMAVIVIPRGGHELTCSRLLSGCVALIVVQAGGGYLGGRYASWKFRRELAARDAAHRKATVASFRADVERITGRPFPTDRDTEQ